jgi:hypothetical protein
MSLTSSTYSLSTQRDQSTDKDTPFTHQISYITLSRTLTRLSTNLLPLSSFANVPHGDLTTQQRLTLNDLLSPLPYHRTKTLSTIEHARTLLLQLELSAQYIKIQRVKRDVVRDLAEKRKVIRKLRGVVEELATEAERRLREGVYEWEEGEYEEGETVEELLGLPALKEEKQRGDSRQQRNDIGTLSGSRNGAEEAKETTPPSSPATTTVKSSRSSSIPHPKVDGQLPSNDLFNLRNRNRRGPNPEATTTTTSSSLPPSIPTNTNPNTTTTTTEKSLTSDRQTQESLTDSLLHLATQLKSQSQSLSHTLTTTDKGQLDRALAGLDANVGGLESASRKMGLLRRMSEGEGWWGRVMLYLWIWGLWVAAAGLVFLGPKLRF